MRDCAGKWALVLTVALLCPAAFAEMYDVDQAIQQSQKAYADHFAEFTKAKNVQRKAKTIDGKVIGNARENKDDKNKFQDDTTYHDLSFDSKDEQHAQQNPQGKPRKKLAHTSDHGSLADSSLLERRVWQAHEKYSKQQEEEDQENQKDLEKGIKYESLFKITTQEAQQNQNQRAESAGSGAGNQDENIKVERRQIREEVKAEIEEVGTISYESIEKAAKDKESQDAPNVLPNSTLLAEAAYRAGEAWWSSTLSNLGQGLANRGIRTKGGVSARPTLSEDMPDCDTWASKALEETQRNDPNNTQRLQVLQKELGELTQKCKQMTQQKYDVVNPTFEDDGRGDAIKPGDLQKENSQVRDNRNQLQVLKDIKFKPSSAKSAWKYKDEEFKSEVAIDYQDGESVKALMTMEEQVDSYNQQLVEAAEGADEVNAKLPKEYQLDKEQILSYQIEGGSPIEIMKRAAKKEYDETMNTDDVVLPESYDELLKAQ